MNLTRHFTLAEMLRSDTAERRGLNNTPSNVELENLYTLCETLEQVRSLLGDRQIKINSGYRSPAVNRAVGGSSTSAHLKGMAADFVVKGLELREAFEAIKASPIKFDQLIYENTWIHLGLRHGTMRRETLRMAVVKGRTKYFPA